MTALTVRRIQGEAQIFQDAKSNLLLLRLRLRDKFLHTSLLHIFFFGSILDPVLITPRMDNAIQDSNVLNNTYKV